MKGVIAELLTRREIVREYRRKILPLHKHIMKASSELYNVMGFSVYTLLQNKLDELMAESGYSDAVKEYWLSNITLEQTIGGKI